MSDVIRSPETAESFPWQPMFCLYRGHVLFTENFKMNEITSLIPARFLTITSHFVILVTILLARQENVRSAIDWSKNEANFNAKDKELLIGLIISVVLLGYELLGFFSGISMFSSTQAILSIMCHTTASICLAIFACDSWPVTSFWWIFGSCSAFPALVETMILIGVLLLKIRV